MPAAYARAAVSDAQAPSESGFPRVHVPQRGVECLVRRQRAIAGHSEVQLAQHAEVLGCMAVGGNLRPRENGRKQRR